VAFLKDGRFWKQQIDLALAVRQQHERWWDENIRAYAPSAKGEPLAYSSNIHTNRTFTMVERKKADLFYRRPDVILDPSPIADGPIPGLQTPPTQMGQQPGTVPMSAALQAHEDIVNEKLGEDGIDASDLMDRVMFDIITTQGVGFTEMGYESVTVPTLVTQPDPMTGQDAPVIDPTTGQPQMSDVPIYENCFWEHFSGKQALIPHNFRSTNWDKAPWLGRRIELPLTDGNRKKYKLPPDFTGSTNSDTKQHYDHGADQTTGQDVFTGTVIWYRSALYRDDIIHPEHFTLLVLVDGIDEPVIQVDSPHQGFAPDGSLTADSLLGNPIHPFSVRTITDSAYVPSDATMIRPLENELDVFREQMVKFRDASTLRFIANADTLPKDLLAKIMRTDVGGIVSVPGEAFVGDGAIRPLEHGSLPRESFVSNDYIDNDIARTLSIDAQQVGAQGESRTATADQIQQQNANARLDKERAQLLKRYCKGVTKFATLIARYTSLKEAAAIIGPQRAQYWDAFRKQIPCSLAFTAMPDSALRIDAAVDRKQATDLYSFLANDPLIQNGRQKLLEKLLRKHHIDPTGIVSPPNPPKPEPPKLALSFKGEDLVGPQAPIVLEILQQQGIQISPAAVQQSQGMLLQAEQMAAAQAQEQANKPGGDTKHGGKLAQQESLSKHHADNTGAMQGIGGAPAAMGKPGGMLQ